MLGALELSSMPIWCPDDYYIFMDAFSSLEPIVKKPRYGVETFDDGYDRSLITLSLDGYSSSVTDGALKISSTPDSECGRVNVAMRKSNIAGNTHFLESDFKIERAECGEIMRFDFRAADGVRVLSSLTLECYIEDGVKLLRLKDTFAGADGEAMTIIDGLALGEWHRLRMTTYKLYGASYRVLTKVNVDDRYITTTDSAVMDGDAPLDIALYTAKIDVVSTDVELYLDNVMCEKSYLPYSG
jgi:hypothetical protein